MKEGRLRLRLRRQGTAKIVVRNGEVRIELDRGPVARDCFRHAVQAVKCPTQKLMDPGAPLAAAKGALQPFDGSFRLSGLQRHEGEKIKRAAMPRIKGEDFVADDLRIAKPSRRM